MSDDRRPTFGPIWLACKKCQHAWDDWQPVDVPIDTWIAHVKTYHCPQCGAGSRYVVPRTNPLDESAGQ